MRNATMPASRQESPRSGGRTTATKRSDTEWETATAGSAALAPRRRETTAPATQPRLRVAPPAPVTAPRAPFVLLVLCFVVAGVIGILWLNTKINENAFRMQHLQQQQGTLDRQEQRLKQDLAQQEDPGNLAAAARRQGAVPMTNQAFINLPDGKQIGVPKPASGGAKAAGTPAARPGNNGAQSAPSAQSGR